MTIFPAGVSYLSSFANVNLSLGASASQSLFQASSVANEITYLSAKILMQTGADNYLVIGPTNGADPTSTNGSVYISNGINYRGAGLTASPTLSTANTIYQMGSVSWVADAAEVIISVESLIIQPGYFVYIKAGGAGGSFAYNVQQVTVKQS